MKNPYTELNFPCIAKTLIASSCFTFSIRNGSRWQAFIKELHWLISGLCNQCWNSWSKWRKKYEFDVDS